MGRYRRILAAFDGSDSGKNALRQAIRLSRTEKSWIKVVAVAPRYEGEIDLTGVRDIEGAVTGPARRFIAEAEVIASAENASVITNIEQGEVYERIVDVASAENCDIIIMGRRGKGRIEKSLMGSVTARVIGHTDRDVLVVPRYSTLGFRRILLPTDGSEFSRTAAERAIDIAKTYSGELAAISVVDVTEEFHAQAPHAVEKLIERAREILGGVKGMADAAGVPFQSYVKEGEVPEVVTGLARELGAELVVMGSHGRTGLSRLLMGSVAERCIGYSPCPVLVVGHGR